MRPRPVAFAVIALACALVLWPPRPARHDLRITFIDVGQGDAILVQTPRGHSLMIDTGGKLERGKTMETTLGGSRQSFGPWAPVCSSTAVKNTAGTRTATP
jgi:beta-lactamase superfamily II metal-dependent hydrolase